LATRVEPQGVAPPGVAEKSPLATMLAMVNAELRLLFSVTIFGGLVVPIAWPAKVTLEGEKLTGKTPAPERS